LSLHGPWRLMTIRADADIDDRIGARLARIEPRILLTQRSPGITVLIPSSVLRERPTLTTLFAQSPALAGRLAVISDTDCQRSRLRILEDEMWSCIRILSSLGVEEGIHQVEEFANYTEIFGTAPDQVAGFMDRMLADLRDWDRQ